MGKDRPIVMSFRTWELYEYILLPITSRQVWTVKTSNQLEKPRFVILGFQTTRKDQKAVIASQFDHCNLTNVKLFLNSQSYPYGNLNLDVNRNQFAILYDMYANFQNSSQRFRTHVEKVTISHLHAPDSDRLLETKRDLKEQPCRHSSGI